MKTIENFIQWVTTYLYPEQLLSRFKVLNKIALESLNRFQNESFAYEQKLEKSVLLYALEFHIKTSSYSGIMKHFISVRGDRHSCTNKYYIFFQILAMQGVTSNFSAFSPKPYYDTDFKEYGLFTQATVFRGKH